MAPHDRTQKPAGAGGFVRVPGRAAPQHLSAAGLTGPQLDADPELDLMRWALSLAMLLLMLAGGLTLERRHKPPASRQSPTNSYSPTFPPWSRATSPKPSSRCMACSRNRPRNKSMPRVLLMALLFAGGIVRANAARDLCLVEPAPDRARSQSLARRSANRSAPPCSNTGRIC